MGGLSLDSRESARLSVVGILHRLSGTSRAIQSACF